MVDVTEDKMYEYIYEKSSIKEGANHVASVFLYHLITFVLDNFRHGEGIKYKKDTASRMTVYIC